MANIKSGQLHLTRKEVAELQVMVNHTLTDISFGGGGSYNLGDSDNSHDEKEAKKAKNAIETIKFIVKNSIIR